ncbi:winged helix DNA-binding domain-containing protein [Actinokineospora sp. HUAS TT18]|uniref:winged helix DNA-binding domain-containing protein n=1 Tax=Actinokineospora sp. HUAS TT18 TaxID=3447451 RepID=UPI003F51CACB
MTDVLSPRALNRATLARQLLLARSELPAVTAIERLAGLQGQAPDAPYVGLWSRLRDFHADELVGPVADRAVVRSLLMRGTVHLVTADDCLALWPAIRPVLDRGLRGHYASEIAGLDVDAVVEAGRALLTERPLTRAELGKALADRWPGTDPATLAYVVSYLAPTVQVTPRGLWRQSGPAAHTTVEAWLDRPVGAGMSLDELVLRYLAAFGPASVRDAQTWSGLTRLKEVFERLRPRLRVFADVKGKELFDLPDAPRPDPDTPAPPRFLPEYDNVLLSHADRTRVIPDGRRVPLPPGNGARCGTLLIDGEFQATWTVERDGDVARLVVDSDEVDAIAEEGARMLDFLAPGSAHAIRFRAGR